MNSFGCVGAFRVSLAYGLSTAISLRSLKKAKLWIDVTFPAGYAALGVLLDIFVAPLRPPGTPETSEQLQVRTGRTRLDDIIDLVGLARVLSLASDDDVGLSPAWRQSPHGATHTEQDEFRHIPEIEPDTSPVWAPVSTHFVPDQVRLVRKPPPPHHLQTFG